MFSMRVYSLFRFVLIKLRHRGEPSACIHVYRVSTTPGNTGNLMEFEIPPGNTGNLLDFC